MTAEQPRYRVERLIALLRLVLAAGSLIALLVDPTQPRAFSRDAARMVLVYAGYAGFMLLVWRRVAASRRLRLLMVAVDLGMAVVLMALTTNPTGLFFVYFVFALFCATLRWQWRGTVWTAAIVLLAFGSLGTYTGWATQPGFEFNLFVIRVVYLGTVSAFLAYIGWHEEQRRTEIARLAAWPRTTARDLAGVLEQTLAHAATILAAPRLVLVWERSEEPWIDVASWQPGGFTQTREPPGPLAEVAARHGVDAAAVPLRGSDGEGLLAVPGRDLTADEPALAEIVGREVTAIVEQHLVADRLRVAAIGSERLRFARDLHDGLLQALTGARLQLQAVTRDTTAAESVRDRLVAIESALAISQRELRTMIDDLRPFPRVDDPDGPLPVRLAGLRRRIEVQWGLAVALDVDDAVADVPSRLAGDVFLLVQEALINVARHAHATTARVRVAVQAGQIEIAVVDDGKGFTFVGKRGLAELAGVGPSSLAERIVALDGELEIESGTAGATVEMRVPLAEASP
jgi:signal transduction histidine kinase